MDSVKVKKQALLGIYLGIGVHMNTPTTDLGNFEAEAIE